MVTRVKKGRITGTKHTFIASAVIKAFVIAKLVFANASRATKAPAAVVPLVRKTATATGFAARFSKVAVRMQTITPLGMARKHSCAYAIQGGPGQRAVCAAVPKVLTLWHTTTE